MYFMRSKHLVLCKFYNLNSLILLKISDQVLNHIELKIIFKNVKINIYDQFLKHQLLKCVPDFLVLKIKHLLLFLILKT